jgi:hypothetical protein
VGLVPKRSRGQKSSRRAQATATTLRVGGGGLVAVGVAGQLLPALTGWGAALFWPSALALWLGTVALIVAARAGGRAGALEAAPDDPGLPVARRLCLLVAPLVLVGIELFHPAGFSRQVYAFLSEPQPGYFGPQWWLALHVIQTPLVGLVGAGLMLLVAGRRGPGAWATRAAALLFVVYYTVLDSIGGVFVGWLLSGPLNAPDAATRPAVQQLVGALWSDPLIGGVGSVVSQVGSWAAFVAAGAAAIVLAGRRGPLWPLLALALAGVLVQVSHARPTGPLGFAMLFLAAVGLELWRPAPAAAGETETGWSRSSRPSPPANIS